MDSLHTWVVVVAVLELLALFLAAQGARNRCFPTARFRELPVAFVGWTSFLIASLVVTLVVNTSVAGARLELPGESDFIAFLTMIGIVAGYAALLSTAHNLRNRFFDMEKHGPESRLLLTNWLNLNGAVLIVVLGLHIVLFVTFKGLTRESASNSGLYLGATTLAVNLIWFAHAFGTIPAIALALSDGRKRLLEREGASRWRVRYGDSADPDDLARAAALFPTVDEWLARNTRFVMGSDLFTWLGMLRRNGLRCFLNRPLLSATVTVFAAGNSVLGKLSELRHGADFRHWEERLRNGEIPVLVVVGHWRSGTTLLHELLAESLGAIAPTNWECFAPHAFSLLRDQTRAFVPVGIPANRPIDRMRLAWDSPQEDEFGLLNLGLPSPYEAIVFPHTSGRRVSLEERWRAGGAQIAHYLPMFLARVLAARSLASSPASRPASGLGGAGRPLIVLKSPPHTLRMAAIKAALPGARFLEIRRNLFEVYVSTWNLWRDLVSHQGLGRLLTTSSSYGTFVRELMRVAYRDERPEKLPDYAVLHYDEIVPRRGKGGPEVDSADIAGRVLGAVSSLRLALPTKANASLRAALEQRSGYRRNRHAPLTKQEVADLRSALEGLPGTAWFDWTIPQHLSPG